MTFATVKDMTGLRFGRLLVVGRLPQRPGKEARWALQCDCGASHEADGSRLRRGITSSCGCYQREGARLRSTKHGMTRHPAYRSWLAMKKRCFDPKHEAYHRYGGRGITVCAKWRSSFEAFWQDMSAGFAPDLQLERINNDGHYEPGNCCWASRIDQGRNRSNNRLLETPWGVLCVSAAAERLGLPHNTLASRIKRGWPPEHLFAPQYRAPRDLAAHRAAISQAQKARLARARSRVAKEG